MSYLTTEELTNSKFKFLGQNVKISDKASIYNCDQMSIGDNVRIDDFCVLSGKLKLGRNVHLAPFVLLAGGSMGIEMGDFSGCAYHVQIFSQSDDYSGKSMTNPTVPSEYKKEIKKAIAIGKHVIVGTNSIVFPGANIAEGCSIGAFTLVTKQTLPWGIYVGNPARRVKERSKELLDFESQILKSEIK